jgi:hypothetical protein
LSTVESGRQEVPFGATESTTAHDAHLAVGMTIERQSPAGSADTLELASLMPPVEWRICMSDRLGRKFFSLTTWHRRVILLFNR